MFLFCKCKQLFASQQIFWLILCPCRHNYWEMKGFRAVADGTFTLQ